MNKRTLRYTVAVAVLACAACESTGGPATGTVRLYLTDAPLAGVASATVWIARAELVGGSGGPVTITDQPQQHDLLALQGGVTALLGEASIPAGDYAQLRLIVDSARVTLEPGRTFSDGSSAKTLFVPSGMQTGIKVNFGTPVHIEAGVTVLVADFDVSRSFVFQGPPPAPHSIHFQPVIHCTVMDVAGSIAGTVAPASAVATLYAIVQGTTDTVASAAADATTGAYTLRFLPPAAYTVAATAIGFQTATQNVTVGAAQHVTGVDFTLAP